MVDNPDSNRSPARPLILVTGATGYVGGRLRRRLENLGYRVRCLARSPERLAGRVGPGTEVVAGDVLDAGSLAGAFDGVAAAFYLVHSMGSSGGFEEQDRLGARNFGAAAREAGVERIIYLGGLARDDGDLSPHLRSRHEVGEILRGSGVPAIELRASIVLGSGSLSFEMIRALVERLPAMITPKWVAVEAQPIAIDDLLEYLVEALDLPAEPRVFEIGGADRASYGDLMSEYARQRELKRLMVPVPVLTPRLSSLWLGLVTPLYARVGKKLIESIEHPSVIGDESAREAFAVRPRGYREAIAAALRSEEREFAETSWFDAFSSAGAPPSYAGVRFRNRLLDSRSIRIDAPPAAAFAPIRRLGGAHGWYAYRFLWRLRGWLDLLCGGVGVRRGRRDPETLHVGDAVDFWRVERYEPDKLLLLRAEMKVPGRAWLEFAVEPDGDGSIIRQTAVYDPQGLFGLLYWYALFPVHGPVFDGMLRGVAERAGGSAPSYPQPSPPDADRKIDPQRQTHQDWLMLQDRALAVAAEGITIADARAPQRPLIYVNEGFERLTGYTASEVLGHNCRFLQGPDADPDTVETIRTALREGSDCTVEILNHHKNGRPFWNRLSITPVRDDAGAVTHFIGIQSDVTARRRAEESLRRANDQMRRNLEEAALIQRNWLPRRAPEVPGYAFAWNFRPCDELAGDGLNILRLDEHHVGLHILDVSGHGVPAALLSASLNRMLSPLPEQSSLYEPAPDSPTGYAPAAPAAVATTLNRQFRDGPATGRFFTLLYGILDLRTRRFRYTTAGHPPPVRISAEGAHLCPLAKGLPVGALPEFEFGEVEIQLDPGDRLLIYTDGAFEAIDANDQEMGEQRLLDALAEFHSLPPDEALAAMVQRIEAWCPGEQPQDDVTLLAVDVLPDEEPGPV